MVGNTSDFRGNPFFYYLNRVCLFSALIFLITDSAKAQSVENIKITTNNELIFVEYDLVPGGGFTIFKVQLYASFNNYSEPLRYVSGDVGDRVTAGFKKLITWAAKSELINYKGDLEFEIRAEPIPGILPYEFTAPLSGSAVRRTKEIRVQWTGGEPEENVQLQLIQNNQVRTVVGNMPNTSEFVWKIPSSIDKGVYQILLTAQSGMATSKPFKIKSKTSGFVKILPIAAAGVVIYLLSSSATDTSVNNPGSNFLPTPPDPN